MSVTPVHPVWRGSARLLTLSATVTAAAAAAVLAVGTQDIRLLRLGLVAALWAALLGAFAAARLRREVRSSAEHVQQLNATYRLELEREVSARREHALRMERELCQQVELSQRRELVALRTEIAAMRVNLELLGSAPLLDAVTLRPEPSRFPVLAPRFGPGRSQTSTMPGRRTVGDLLAAHGALPTPRRRRAHASPESWE